MNELRDKVKMPAYEYGKLIGKIESLQESLLTAQGQLKELKGFGRHKNLCRLIGGYDGPCDCGLDNLLTQLEK